MNCGRLPDTSGWPAIIGCSASTCAGTLGALVRLGQDGIQRRRHVSMLRDGGPVLRRAGRVEGGRGQERRLRRLGEALALERLVSGVPPAPSTGGAGGLPDLPREGRGLGVVSRGGRGMGPIYGAAGAVRQSANRVAHRTLQLAD